jgi:hypothetical protein
MIVLVRYSVLAWLWLLLLGGHALSAQEPVARPAFGRVLWVPQQVQQDVAALREVRRAGFNGVNLARGVEPGQAVAAGLGYYLDQPMGKGLLELRDEPWQGVAKDYEQHRNPAVLVRPTCLRDEQALQAAEAALADSLQRAAGPAMWFVALADEASATRHDAPLDTCRCDRCLHAFREFAHRRYAGQLGAMELAWGVAFDSWEDVEPLTTDQIRRRELGGVLLPTNLQPWSDWLEFCDLGFAAAVERLLASAEQGAGDAPVGLTGLSAPAAFGGQGMTRLLSRQRLLEPYPIGGAQQLAWSLAPKRAERWSTLFVPDEAREFGRIARAHLAAAAARGDSGVVVWNHERVFGESGVTAAGRALQGAFEAMAGELDLLAGARLEASDIWLVESQASVRAWWMLDSVADGLTWVRRLASYEAEHSTSQAARVGWIALLGDLGMTPRIVREEDLMRDLARRPPKLVVLPASIALSDRACQAIVSYVHGGGALLADHTVALYDGDLRRREVGRLDALFGVQERGLRIEDIGVREGRSLWQGGVETRLKGATAERRGGPHLFLENQPARKAGRAVYLNMAVCDYNRMRLDPGEVVRARELRRRVQQVLHHARVAPPFDVRGSGLPTCLVRTVLEARDGRRIGSVRVDALDRPELLAQLAAPGPTRVTLSFPRPVALRDLGGEAIGEGEQIELDLDVYQGLFFEMVSR